MADRLIAVAGNIGVGKTSLVEYLTTEYNFVPVYEPFAANPYLDDFYDDMRTWAFRSQLWFLATKFRLHLTLEAADGTLVQDRSIYEDAEIFATYLHRTKFISDRDFDTYSRLYESMKVSLEPPDLMIYLRCSVRSIRKRVKQRGRASEQDIPTSYLRSLNTLYEEWIERWDDSPVLVWDSERMDYLGDLVHQLQFRRAIEAFL